MTVHLADQKFSEVPPQATKIIGVSTLAQNLLCTQHR